ncbi:hypothetical protein BT96DRAFT_914841 [Gymnopus androsaceus JB14]|uniref:MoaB/Mog domain-containing protein n=1 Tax=Gymnopus androsaceus JB14 TaxID=1447944 RepID=A0A6A4I9H3_9AGAR|nr:hypothetical protein BT96DRAFT_914841 [Gymnopus androsaceus JB14]
MSQDLDSKIRVAILTVSDRASEPNPDPSYDKSSPAIRDLFANYSAFACVDHVTVPDDILAIQEAVKKWVTGTEGVDWIVTTGGTGFGIKDRTPEAISPLLTRPAPGLVHLLLSSSLKHTTMAALSRPIAGTISKSSITNPGQDSNEFGPETLIVTLPDSGTVVHAVELMKGGDGSKSGQGVHGSSETGSGHGHRHHRSHRHRHGAGSAHSAENHDHHHHHTEDRRILSHDPSQAVSTRHRTSPYPIVSFKDALEMIHENIKHLPIVTVTVNASLRGHILAEDVYASADLPPTKTTSVDGYALKASQPAGTYKELPEGCIYRINTGGALPRGADTVIMVEDTKVVATYPEASSDATLAGPPGEEWKRYNVRQPGSDVRQGDLVMRKGEVGSLIFIGKKEIKVYKKPVVALLSTGNEIRDLSGSVSATGTGEGDWKSWDTNRPSLAASLEGMGYDVVDLGIVPDEIEAHVHALEEGLARADIILTTGGTSMGPTDLLKPVIERRLGGEVKFGRVSVKPGKPTTFAVISVQADSETALGETRSKPLSALVTFNVFVVPALRKLGGWEFSGEGCELPKVKVELQQPMPLDPRTEFHRVILRKLKAYSTGGQRSSRVASLSGANGLVILPQKEDGGKDEMDSGEMAEAIVIGEILR